ncbi:MAG: NAD(P)H:quinone oxidoreductase [Candidatus Bathyarchaeota archaeon]|nr:NAD(P)H:quinone oxidoreductase [Candidatus Bathyarchaeota archaeon]MDH5745560.1 NAD(P)H:quinone oxidoreductase [Candidatus Bathyarchaeota archaeon]
MVNEHKPKILVVFYSMYGHIFRMAEAAVEGIREAGGVPILKQVAELIPEQFWNEEIRRVKDLMRDVPVADPRKDLDDIDGAIIGTPTRFGNMCAQMRNFWDQTGPVWMKGNLIGKPAAVFTSSNNQHGGQETTIISTHFTLLHHGFVVVGLPYSFKEQMTMEEIAGGSPYGASTVAGSGPPYKRMPTTNELKMAKDLGKHLTAIARKLSS